MDQIQKKLAFYKGVSIISVLILVSFISFFIGAYSVGGFGATNDPLSNILKISKDDIVYGNKNADIIIFEYSDLECPYCNNIHKTIQRVISEDSNVAWVYRHLPLPFHQSADEAAVLSECIKNNNSVAEAGEYIDEIFKNFGAKGVGYYRDIAKATTGITDEKLDRCLAVGSKEQNDLKKHLEQAQILGINGTPGGFIINKRNKKIQQLSGAIPYEQLISLINLLN